MSTQLWQKILGDILEKTDPNTKPVLQNHIDEISSIASNVVNLLDDGFQWQDVIGFYYIVGPVMDIAKEISEYSGEDKEQFVVDTMWMIYQAVDTYPDGESNRINIPLLFGGLEKKFEKALIDFVTRSSVKAVYKFGKEKGYF